MIRTKLKFLQWLKRLSGIIVLLGMWELLSLFFPPIIVPSVERVFLTLSQMVISGEIWLPLIHTVSRVLIGVSLSILLGGILGTLAGLINGIHEAIRPVIVIIENTPPVVWVIIAVIWFGGYPSNICYYVYRSSHYYNSFRSGNQRYRLFSSRNESIFWSKNIN
ncbi:ABC transporter permease [Petrotoga sp. DB-2]